MGAVEEGGGHTGECLSASLDVTQENAKLLNENKMDASKNYEKEKVCGFR